MSQASASSPNLCHCGAFTVAPTPLSEFRWLWWPEDDDQDGDLQTPQSDGSKRNLRLQTVQEAFDELMNVCGPNEGVMV